MSLSLSQRLSIKRFTKGEPSQHASIELNHRRIFILPSKGGLALGLVILLMLIASINYNNSMGFVFTFLLAAAAQASTLYSFKNLSGLSVSLAKSPACYAGFSSQINLRINEPNLRERWTISATHLAEHTLFNIEKNQQLAVSLSVKPTKRGWYKPSTITLSSQFPFGFFRTWSPLLFNQPLLVYPTPLDTGVIISSDQHLDNELGRSSSKSGTDDFAGLKPYQTGHSYRHINWKALAAEKGLYSNEFCAEQTSDIWLDSQACSHLNTEAMLSQLCYWVINCENDGLNYGLRLANIELEPSQGTSHQQLCLKELALYGNA